MNVKLDYAQRRRANELVEWVIDNPDDAAYELIGLRDALAAQPATVRPDAGDFDVDRHNLPNLIKKWQGMERMFSTAIDLQKSRLSEEGISRYRAQAEVCREFLKDLDSVDPAPAPATSAEPLERCPECGGPIFVRGNGTIVAHYGGGIDPNRCKASETKFVRAALRQPGTPATSDLRDTAEKLLAQVDEIIEGVVRCGACGGKFSHRKDCKLIAACDGVRAALEATAPATSAEIEIRLDERKMCAFHNEREDCRCFHCRRIRELAALRQPGTPAEEKK